MAEVLQPGAVLGPYPERPVPGDNWFDRCAHRVAGPFRSLARARLVRDDGWLDDVEAHRRQLRILSDSELAIRTAETRLDLSSNGFEHEVVEQCFALACEAARRSIGMIHQPHQLRGGRLMLHGAVAEMATGEGKTLAATLPACAAGLAGVPVHVVTVNDYLVERDALTMGPVYRMLGLSVGMVTEEMGDDERRSAYACDVTYVSNKQVAFDYLKDRLTLGRRRGRLRLQIDAMRAGPPQPPRTGSQPLLRGLCFAIVDEADSVLIDEARTPLVISRNGDDGEAAATYAQATQLAADLAATDDFVVNHRDRSVELTERGKARVEAVTPVLGSVWQGRRRARELVIQALRASHLYERDRHYLVRDGKVQIIDEYTGRVMADRSWDAGLHQMIEAREGIEPTPARQTLARVSYQQFFRRYLRLAGTTGTGTEVARELWAVYGLSVVPVPPYKPNRRRHMKNAVYRGQEAKWAAVMDRIVQVHGTGRPILVGTPTLAASERLSGLLRGARLAHHVLNARQDQHEAMIVEQAGQGGVITIATNMAGRGTDIKLGPGVAQRGGLHVILTARHEARRIDRQLFGRCARQGDPGSVELIMSFDDDLVQRYCPAAVRYLVSCWPPRKWSPSWLSSLPIALAQHLAERDHARMRRELRRMDQQLADLLSFSGQSE